MPHKLKVLAAIFAVVLALAGCGKYPDGPSFDLSNRYERMGGRKAIAHYSVNTVDSLDFLLDSVFRCRDISWHVSQSHREKSGPWSIAITGCDPQMPTTYTGEWDFRSKKTQIWLRVDGLVGPQFRGQNWDILRLTRDEVWLQLDAFGKRYRLELVDVTNI